MERHIFLQPARHDVKLDIGKLALWRLQTHPPVRLLPFFILTENNDLATEYEYRHEGVNDYITAPVNIPELIRQVLFFVE